MYGVYVLYFPNYVKIYIGQSSQVAKRLHFHNHGPRKGWTARYRPWELLYSEEFATRSDAIKREQQLKSARGRRWIWEELLGKEE
ncbi:MAG: GIY-YIG nuclease family protein [Candidatus Halalkalibacterium sp. M3_1C_030]